MGLRAKCWAKVWGQPKRVTGSLTSVRISVSRKDKDSGEYITTFSDFVSFSGSATATKALGLKEGDSIYVNDVDIETKYDKNNNKKYYNFYIRSYNTQSEYDIEHGRSGGYSQQPNYSDPTPANVDDGEVDITDDHLPF